MGKEKLTFNEFTGEMIKLKPRQKNPFTYKALVEELNKALLKNEKNKMPFPKEDGHLAQYHKGWSNCAGHFIQLIENFKEGNYKKEDFYKGK